MASNVVATARTSDGAVNAGVPESTLYGWSVLLSTASTGIEFRVGTATGDIVGKALAGTSASTTSWFGPQGVKVPGLIWVEFTGTAAGTVVVYHS